MFADFRGLGVLGLQMSAIFEIIRHQKSKTFKFFKFENFLKYAYTVSTVILYSDGGTDGARGATGPQIFC